MVWTNIAGGHGTTKSYVILPTPCPPSSTDSSPQCTEYGYIQTGNTPPTTLPLISRLIDLKYGTFFCRAAFNITTPPEVENVNKYGGFDISYPRLANIGGQTDPWRPATPLADKAKPRKSTTSEPFWEIPDAVHHWDENGLFENETTSTLPPNSVAYAQELERDFVKAWLRGEFGSFFL
jgi:hypothetical protein